MKYLFVQICVIALGFVLYSCNQHNTSETQESDLPPTTQEGAMPKDSSASVSATKPDPADSKQAYGIDISKFQGDEISSLSESKDSLHFIICKATEGVTYTDPDFSKNWKEIPEKGFIRGAYHFFRSNDDPNKQADFFTKMIADLRENDLPPVIDFEKGGISASQSAEAVATNFRIMLEAVEKKMNRKPIIYVNIGDGNKYLTDPAFAEYPLWIANYTERDQPNLPRVWEEKGWIIWQQSESYEIESTTDDFDRHNGTVEDLKAFIRAN